MTIIQVCVIVEDGAEQEEFLADAKRVIEQEASIFGKVVMQVVEVPGVLRLVQ